MTSYTGPYTSAPSSKYSVGRDAEPPTGRSTRTGTRRFIDGEYTFRPVCAATGVRAGEVGVAPADATLAVIHHRSMHAAMHQ